MSFATLEDAFSVQQFLYSEARLLDECRFRDWLALLSDEVRYIMPVRELLDPRDKSNSQDSFKIFDDDKASLEMRVSRYETGLAHAEAPPSVTHRMIANVEIVERLTETRFVVCSNFLVSQERLRSSAAEFRGRRRDIIERCCEGWRVFERRIELSQSILPSTISIFF